MYGEDEEMMEITRPTKANVDEDEGGVEITRPAETHGKHDLPNSSFFRNGLLNYGLAVDALEAADDTRFDRSIVQVSRDMMRRMLASVGHPRTGREQIIAGGAAILLDMLEGNVEGDSVERALFFLGRAFQPDARGDALADPAADDPPMAIAGSSALPPPTNSTTALHKESEGRLAKFEAVGPTQEKSKRKRKDSIALPPPKQETGDHQEEKRARIDDDSPPPGHPTDPDLTSHAPPVRVGRSGPVKNEEQPATRAWLSGPTETTDHTQASKCKREDSLASTPPKDASDHDDRRAFLDHPSKLAQGSRTSHVPVEGPAHDVGTRQRSYEPRKMGTRASYVGRSRYQDQSLDEAPRQQSQGRARRRSDHQGQYVESGASRVHYGGARDPGRSDVHSGPGE